MLLQLDQVAREFGSRVLFSGVSLNVRSGDRIGLVGPNGTGKTSLLRIAAGIDEPDHGLRRVAGGANVALLRQEVDPRSDVTVAAEVGSVFAHLDRAEAALRSLEAEIAHYGARHEDPPPELAQRYDRAQEQFAREGGFDRHARVDRVLEGLGFDGAARARPLASFSGGWLMRVELAKLLLSEPDVLLLDEPTNHLDLPSIQWFEGVLQGFRGAVVTVSHDRAFLERNASRILELRAGRGTLYEMGFSQFLAERERRAEALAAQARKQERRVAETERFVERFRAKASKARQVQSRIKSLEKLERIEAPGVVQRRPVLRIPPPARSGELVLSLRNVHKAYGDTVVYAGVDLELLRGEKMALVGPNGAGKSTLLRIAAGTLSCDAGVRELGHNVTVAYYAQHQLEVLEAGRTVLEELASDAHFDDHPRLRGHLGAFLFSGEDVDKKVAVLSGGEKARLALAKLLLRPANLLVLDEPTNHLDIEAREVLEAALRGFEGTVLFISHDRALINELASVVCEVRAGAIERHLGNYDRYLERVSASGDEPAPARGAPGDSEAKARRMEERELRRGAERLRRKLGRLEEHIEELEAEVEILEAELGDPEIYTDAEALRARSDEIAEKKRTCEAELASWEALSEELEALEASLSDPR